jgi:hypothetical protein
MSSAWDWFYSVACQCVDQCGGDADLGAQMMVERLVARPPPREVWEDEVRAYCHTASVRRQLEGMSDEEIIEEGLAAGMRERRRCEH